MAPGTGASFQFDLSGLALYLCRLHVNFNGRSDRGILNRGWDSHWPSFYLVTPSHVGRIDGPVPEWLQP
ncbi:hypothetical protein NDU88_000811 [Pleurodeles waltl]|uniref:Uncharacterized protein n=1 Tax=Pleurodeles waltl TaxID=8319 RepID=A0AAV7MJ61_PLEWA|nr:hypothetical protein NDU88_000811 [Pleurodeles waltl]